MSSDPSERFASARRFLRFLRDRPGGRCLVRDVQSGFVDGTVAFYLKLRQAQPGRADLELCVEEEQACVARSGLAATTTQVLTQLGLILAEPFSFQLTPQGRRFIDLPVEVEDGLRTSILLLLHWNVEHDIGSREIHFLAGLTGVAEARFLDVARSMRQEGLLSFEKEEPFEVHLAEAGRQWLLKRVGRETARGMATPMGSTPLDRSLADLQALAALLSQRGQEECSQAFLALAGALAGSPSLLDDQRHRALEKLQELAKLAAWERQAPPDAARALLENLESLASAHADLSPLWSRWKGRLRESVGL